MCFSAASVGDNVRAVEESHQQHRSLQAGAGQGHYQRRSLKSEHACAALIVLTELYLLRKNLLRCTETTVTLIC